MINIYVGNLSSSTTENELRAKFEKFGKVSSVKIIIDKLTGESKGFAFVEMPNKSEGEQAIIGLNKQELNGKMLNVNEARPRTGGFGGGNGNGNGGGRSSGGRNRY